MQPEGVGYVSFGRASAVSAFSTLECPCCARIRMAPSDWVTANLFLSLFSTTAMTSSTVSPLQVGARLRSAVCRMGQPWQQSGMPEHGFFGARDIPADQLHLGR